MSELSILAELIPVCPTCHRVMRRCEWSGKRPRAICHLCGKTHYFAEDGRIVMTAKLRSAA